ncbi:hypothetical protein [Nocardia noduli]|uniref:hypothetical protein n=1 Tax=Nocardia noduli TaxID=2815722 RepID=UPI0020B41AC7|nr:hypothetical protein [Nocardia noduli]
MFIKKLVTTAFMAIAATGIATATAQGEAGLADVSFDATDGPIAYTASLAADHSSALVSLASGTFVVTPDAVEVRADDGAVVGSIPTTLRTDAGQSFEVTPVVDASATQLSLTPVGGPLSRDIPGTHEVGGPITVLAGAGIGCLIGIALGIWFFVVGAIAGCAIGAVIGAGVGFLFVPGP